MKCHKKTLLTLIKNLITSDLIQPKKSEFTILFAHSRLLKYYWKLFSVKLLKTKHSKFSSFAKTKSIQKTQTKNGQSWRHPKA